YAINIKNGSVLWKKSLGEYVRSSAICSKTHIFVGSISSTQKAGTLWCLSKATGDTVWRRNVAPIFSSPILDREEVIVGTDDEYLYCFDTAGKQKWRVGLGGKVRSTPAVAKEFVYAGSFGGIFYKIRRLTGEVVWRNSESGSLYSSPALGKGFVTVGNNGGLVMLFQTATGKKMSEYATGGPVTASPLIINRFVLIGSNDGRFYVLDGSAKAVCTFEARTPLNSSACYRDNMIFVGTDQGLLALGL
ncbi:MAG TPA: PQQ-binding-like beta-propeller repeat protein, partial [Acidobacteriota bacterium]|nr:PQQ-binding-like beta-propeller repeat protein [Acidobacteriota bacterium]